MDNEAKSLGGLLDNRIAELEEENAMLRERCETAGYMIEMARMALFGVSGDGTNALAPRVIMEWALGQIEATPGAENYYSIAFGHAMAPDIGVVVCIQRRDKETPAGRAARLQAELEQARADAQVLLGLAAAEYTARKYFRDVAGLNAPEMDAMYAAADRADAVPDTDVSAVIRRVLATDVDRRTADLKQLKEV